MLHHLTESISKVVKDISIIVGYRGEDVISAMGESYNYVWQREQLGTGHAVACARESLEKLPIENLIVLPGDHPFISSNTIAGLLDVHEASGATVSLATIRVPGFDGESLPFLQYGRIVRDAQGTITRIVEYKDATDEEKAITEVNASYYAFNPKWLWENINSITTANNAHEFYLTDLIERAVSQNQPIASYIIQNPIEGMGANTPEHIEVLEKLVS